MLDFTYTVVFPLLSAKGSLHYADISFTLPIKIVSGGGSSSGTAAGYGEASAGRLSASHTSSPQLLAALRQLVLVGWLILLLLVAVAILLAVSLPNGGAVRAGPPHHHCNRFCPCADQVKRNETALLWLCLRCRLSSGCRRRSYCFSNNYSTSRRQISPQQFPPFPWILLLAPLPVSLTTGSDAPQAPTPPA
jgi:hypothetical protein